MFACRVGVAAPPVSSWFLAGTALQVALTACGAGVIGALGDGRFRFARLALVVRESRLAGIVGVVVVAASPEEAGFALEAAQYAVTTVRAGIGGAVLRPGSGEARQFDLRELRQLTVQGLVVVGNHLLIVSLPGGDGIQLVFHPLGVTDLHEVEAVAQAIDDGLAEFARHEETVDRLHIPFAGQGADDGRVGGGAADALAFQGFH